MESIIGTFHIDWKIVAAQAINFAVVLAVLYFFALKPLQRVMKERSEKIAKGLGDAERHAALLSGAGTEKEAILAEARAESTRIVETARADGEELKKKLLASAKEEAAKLQADAQKKLKDERGRLLVEVKGEIGSLIVSTIEKTLGDVLDARTQGKMVEQALAAIRNGGSRETDANVRHSNKHE